MRQLPSVLVGRAMASLSRGQLTYDPDAANYFRTMSSSAILSTAGICDTLFLLQFRTHNNLVAEGHCHRRQPPRFDAIDLHGEKGEYLNEIRDNTVISGNKHKHDASGPGNWVHSNTYIGNRHGILVILGTPPTSSRTIGSQLGKNRRPASNRQCTGHGVAR